MVAGGAGPSARADRGRFRVKTRFCCSEQQAGNNCPATHPQWRTRREPFEPCHASSNTSSACILKYRARGRQKHGDIRSLPPQDDPSGRIVLCSSPHFPIISTRMFLFSLCCSYNHSETNKIYHVSQKKQVNRRIFSKKGILTYQVPFFQPVMG